MSNHTRREERTSYYQQCRDALLDARDKLSDMQDYADKHGIQRSSMPNDRELRVAIGHLEELLEECEEA